jgi:hypothetical protein
MGLDWCLRNKPRDNDKDKEEFYRLKYKLKLHRDMEYNEQNEEKVKILEEEIEKLEEQFNNVSIDPKNAISNLTEDEIITLNAGTIGREFNPDSLDFRGNVVGRSDILDEDLKMEAYEHHNAEQCIEYAIKLEIFIESLNKKELDKDQQEDCTYIIKAINWLKFWGKKGHGYYAWY